MSFFFLSRTRKKIFRLIKILIVNLIWNNPYTPQNFLFSLKNRYFLFFKYWWNSRHDRFLKLDWTVIIFLTVSILYVLYPKRTKTNDCLYRKSANFQYGQKTGGKALLDSGIAWKSSKRTLDKKEGWKDNYRKRRTSGHHIQVDFHRFCNIGPTFDMLKNRCLSASSHMASNFLAFRSLPMHVRV